MKKLLLAAALSLVLCSSVKADPFNVMYQGTKTISCTTTSTATALATGLSASAPIQLELQNKGAATPDTVFLEFGGSGIAATVATGYPVLAGTVKLVSIPKSLTHVACISASGTQTVYVTVGRGE